MSMTYYTVDDLRPGRSGWGVKRFSALNDAISHYRSLPMDGARVLGMADDAHAYELIRCVRLFPGDAQGEDVLAADHWRDGLTKKNAALKDALDICLENLRPRFLLEPERLIEATGAMQCKAAERLPLYMQLPHAGAETEKTDSAFLV